MDRTKEFDWKIVWRDPEELQPYERNAKIHDEKQVKNIVHSIVSFGWKQPLVITKDDVVIIGHGRRLAAIQLKKKNPKITVPCLTVDKDAEELTDADIKKLRNVDNLTNESPWDLEKLNAELSELDMSGFDFDIDIEDNEPEPEVTEDYYDAPLPADPKSQRGDLYILGEHRLLCGDSTDPEDMARLMDGAMADLYLTDPPYGVDWEDKLDMLNRWHDVEHKNRKKGQQAISGDKSTMNLDNLLAGAFAQADQVMAPGTPFYIWHSGRFYHIFREAVIKQGWDVKQLLIWVKNHFVPGLQDYQWKHEPCIYGWKPGAKHYFADTRSESTVFDDKIDVKKLKKDEAIALLQQLLSEKRETTVIYEDKPIAADNHPTSKPVKLIARLVKNSSRRGGIILDNFAGSGSTLIACEQLGRRSYNMELDPKYIDSIVSRYYEFTGRDDIYRIRNGEKEKYIPEA